MKLIWIIPTIAILAACSNKKPEEDDAVKGPTLAEVRLDAGLFIGTQVRWGGMITQVENKATHTWVELVGRKLKDSGRPSEDGVSEGRFIASFEGFSDPAVYKVGRPLTVTGTIEGTTNRSIGQYDYSFPIVAVRGSHLWTSEVRTRVRHYPPPWWYSDYYFYHRPYPYRRW